MLKVIVKGINFVAAVYVVYLVGGAVYEMGKEAGKKEIATESVPVDNQNENNDSPDYKIINGEMYKRVTKK